jgi:RNA polymerase sigma-70 factor (ECF subfamily)
VRLARSVVQDGAAAEDAAQSACARAFASLDTLRDPDRFEAWFYRIVLNEARQRLRRTAREVPLETASDERPGAWRDEVDALVERIDLRQAIEALEPGLRAAIVLRYDFGMSSEEIGRVLSTTAVTARWRLMRAHKKLRALLAPTAASLGFVLAALGFAANRTAVVAEIEQFLQAVTIVSGRPAPMTVRAVDLARARSDMPFAVIEPSTIAGTSYATIDEAYSDEHRSDGIVTFEMHAREHQRDFAIVESRADRPHVATILTMGRSAPQMPALPGIGRRPTLRGLVNGRAFRPASWVVRGTRITVMSPPGMLSNAELSAIHNAMAR